MSQNTISSMFLNTVEKFSENLNLIIENKIKLHPHEYLWQHRRFKSTLGKLELYK